MGCNLGGSASLPCMSQEQQKHGYLYNDFSFVFGLVILMLLFYLPFFDRFLSTMESSMGFYNSLFSDMCCYWEHKHKHAKSHELTRYQYCFGSFTFKFLDKVWDFLTKFDIGKNCALLFVLQMNKKYETYYSGFDNFVLDLVGEKDYSCYCFCIFLCAFIWGWKVNLQTASSLRFSFPFHFPGF